MVKKILIYGAAAQPVGSIRPLGPINIKGRIKSYRDRLLALGRLAPYLDSRNYDLSYTTNVGDIAIAEAIRRQLNEEIRDSSFDNVSWGNLSELRPREVSDKYSAVIIAGSGYFMLSADGRVPKRVEKDAEYFCNISVPIIMYGVGVNRPLVDSSELIRHEIKGTTKDLLTKYFDNVALVGVRSEDSVSFLKGFTDAPIHVTTDPALFLKQGMDNVSRSTQAVIKGHRKKVGLNLPFHGVEVSRMLRSHLFAYIGMLKNIQSCVGCTFHYFVHNHSEWIIPQILRDRGVSVEVIYGEPYAMLRRYAEMDIHLGGMLHSCILAAGVGTPCVILAYDIKHAGFADTVGLQDHCHSFKDFSPARVIDSIKYLLSNCDVERARLSERLEVLWSNQKAFTKECAAIIGGQA